MIDWEGLQRTAAIPERRRWLAEEDDFLRSNWRTMSDQELACHLDRTWRAVRNRIYRLGIPRVLLRRWTPEEDEFIKISGSRPLQEVARVLNRCDSEVSARARKIGIRSWFHHRGGYRDDRDGRPVIGYIKENGMSRRIMAHRDVMERQLGRSLRSDEIVHHIDLNVRNNEIDNLHLCDGVSGHMSVHRSLERLLPELLARGIVGFDKDQGIYVLR